MIALFFSLLAGAVVTLAALALNVGMHFGEALTNPEELSSEDSRAWKKQVDRLLLKLLGCLVVIGLCSYGIYAEALKL